MDPATEAAIRAGKYVLTADYNGERRIRSATSVGCSTRLVAMADDAGHQHLVRRQLCLLPHAPLMLPAAPAVEFAAGEKHATVARPTPPGRRGLQALSLELTGLSAEGVAALKRQHCRAPESCEVRVENKHDGYAPPWRPALTPSSWIDSGTRSSNQASLRGESASRHPVAGRRGRGG
jgi:hypothetical protein